MSKAEIQSLVLCVQIDAWAMAGLILISFEHYITGGLFLLLTLVYHQHRKNNV